jgi:hypothetical protein
MRIIHYPSYRGQVGEKMGSSRTMKRDQGREGSLEMKQQGGGLEMGRSDVMS